MNFAFLWVAFLYFGAVALMRKPFPALTWRWASFFYALVLGLIFLPLTGPYVHLPVDYIFSLSPWDSIKPAHLGSGEMNDLAFQIVPWAHQVRASWMNLEAPLWNAASGGGYPLLANGQSSALSLLRFLVMPLPFAYSFAAEGALKLLIALSFAFIYARRYLSPGASGVVAVSYAFSSFLLVWLQFPIVAVAAFLPAVMLAIDLLVDSVTLFRFGFCSVVFALLLVGGHPETAAHIISLAGLYLLFKAVAARRLWRPIGAVIGAGVVGLLLASPLLLPLIEALPQSFRYEVLKAGPVAEDAGAWLIVPILNPGFFGSVLHKNAWGPGHAEVVCGYGGILGLAAWVALLIVVIKRRQWKSVVAFHLVLAPIALGIIMKWPVIYDIFHSMPLFSLAANGRFRLIFCWVMAFLAGALIDEAIAGETKALLTGIVVAVAVLGSMFALNRFPGPDQLRVSLWVTLSRVAVLAVAGVLLSIRRTRAKSWAVGAVLVVVVADLWLFGYDRNPSVEAYLFYPETPLIRFLEARSEDRASGKTNPFRVAGTSAALFPNTGAMFGFEDIRAHDPMSNARYLGALRYFTGYTTSDYFAMLKNLDDPFIDYLNVRYLVTAASQSYHSDRFSEVYSGRDGKVYENRSVLPRFYAARNVFVEQDESKRLSKIMSNRDWANTVYLERVPSVLMPLVRSDLFLPRASDAPMATVRIVRASTREFHLDIDAPRWTLVIGSQAAWPGWHIERNGRESLKLVEVNFAFMGFIVPPGRSSVVVAYTPRSYFAGLALAGSTATILLAAMAWSLWRRRPAR